MSCADDHNQCVVQSLVAGVILDQLLQGPGKVDDLFRRSLELAGQAESLDRHGRFPIRVGHLIEALGILRPGVIRLQKLPAGLGFRGASE